MVLSSTTQSTLKLSLIPVKLPITNHMRRHVPHERKDQCTESDKTQFGTPESRPGTGNRCPKVFSAPVDMATHEPQSMSLITPISTFSYASRKHPLPHNMIVARTGKRWLNPIVSDREFGDTRAVLNTGEARPERLMSNEFDQVSPITPLRYIA